MASWSGALPAALLLLAGCVGTPSDPASGAPEPQAPVDPDLAGDLNRTFSGKVQLTVSQLNTPANRAGFSGSNCIRFEAGDVERIHHLNATATWQPVTPAQENLELRAHDEGGGRVKQGPSPLQLEERDLVPDEFFDGIFIMVQAPSPAGATLEQQVDVEYTIVYDGDEEPKPTSGGCSFG